MAEYLFGKSHWKYKLHKLLQIDKFIHSSNLWYKTMFKINQIYLEMRSMHFIISSLIEKLIM